MKIRPNGQAMVREWQNQNDWYETVKVIMESPRWF
jgi:hypothetical protein